MDTELTRGGNPEVAWISIDNMTLRTIGYIRYAIT